MSDLPLLWLDEVDSTNTYVVKHFAELADGTLVAAGRQTAGRGRRGRAWIASANENICATLAVKFPGPSFLAGTVVGLAGLDLACELIPGISFFCKWPNDIYAENCKLAGILCEGAGFHQGKLAGVAAGIGLNVNLPQENIHKLDQPAVSLSILAGHTWPFKDVLRRFAELTAEYYMQYRQDPQALFARWKKANRLIGCELDFICADGTKLHGLFDDIAPDGEMILRTVNGVRKLNCGDVHIRRESIPVVSTIPK